MCNRQRPYRSRDVYVSALNLPLTPKKTRDELRLEKQRRSMECSAMCPSEPSIFRQLPAIKKQETKEELSAVSQRMRMKGGRMERYGCKSSSSSANGPSKLQPPGFFLRIPHPPTPSLPLIIRYCENSSPAILDTREERHGTTIQSLQPGLYIWEHETDRKEKAVHLKGGCNTIMVT